MSKINVSEDIAINYEEYGAGRPVVLIHGWPLSHQAWEPQIETLVSNGFRVISYDRRGFGDSSKPETGYEYDTFADDLHQIITQLSLTDVSLVGFSMGGGEVVRYLSRYGSDNIKSVALIASIIPLVKQKEDNPAGVPQEVLDGIVAQIKENREGFLKYFVETFYNYSPENQTVTEEQIEKDWATAKSSLPTATLQAALAWMDTDFREETKKIKVPTLIIHGDADNLVPIATASQQAAEMIADNEFKIYKDGPHGLNLTHKEQFNKDLVAFLKK